MGDVVDEFGEVLVGGGGIVGGGVRGGGGGLRRVRVRARCFRDQCRYGCGGGFLTLAALTTARFGGRGGETEKDGWSETVSEGVVVSGRDGVGEVMRGHV